MTTTFAALQDASRLRASFVQEHGYALAYGSHATSATVRDSDLDLLFVGPSLDSCRHQQLVQEVIALHTNHQLRLDTEVAHEVKLYATPADVEAALALRGFLICPNGQVYVEPAVVAPWFLNTPTFKLRLVLNALTTPHVFLGGNLDQYQRHCAAADRAVALLTLSLLSSRTITVAAAVATLVDGPGGETGEDYLGYSYTPALYSTVQRGLTRLTPEHVVSTTDGVHFTQDIDRRRRLVLNNVIPRTARPVTAETMGN
jgi:hypothetical protein